MASILCRHKDYVTENKSFKMTS